MDDTIAEIRQRAHTAAIRATKKRRRLDENMQVVDCATEYSAVVVTDEADARHAMNLTIDFKCCAKCNGEIAVPCFHAGFDDLKEALRCLVYYRLKTHGMESMCYD